MDKLAYTIPEAEEASNLGRTKLYEYIGRGELVARKAGNKTLILAPDLKEFLENLPTLKARSNANDR